MTACASGPALAAAAIVAVCLIVVLAALAAGKDQL